MTTRESPTPSLTARTPEDVLALVPVVLGFEPTESLVLLTFGAATPFHARLDLPATVDDVPAAVELLVSPARQHGVRRVLLVAYSERGRYADRVLRGVARAFERAGISVIDGLRTDGRRWHPVPGRPGVPAHGVPYDLTAHPFAVQAVYDGRVLHGSRSALAATIATDPARVATVVTALAAQSGPAGAALDEGRWARDLVADHVAAATVPSDAELARLLRGMLDVRVRDAAWSSLTREQAREHAALWTDVVQRSPEPLLAGPAALLGFAAWLAGDGALAWCAVDRCLDADPAYSLGTLVTELLTRAVPPSSWEGPFDWTEGMSPPGAG
jgi:hypothetical protein